MSTNTLNARSNGQTIDEAFFNDLHSAIQTQFVGRNSSGVPTAAQSLGTIALPWGTLFANALNINGSAIDVSQVSAPSFTVQSGKVRTTSNQPAFLTPAGSGNGASVTVAGATTNLVLTIGGTTVTVSTDIVKSSLSLAPSTNNTALVNDTDAADQEATRTWGELDSEKDITIDTVGSEISSLVGTYQAFKINDGTNDEIFWAFVESSTSLAKCFRGYYYDENLAPVNRLVFANNDTITLLQVNYIFADDDSTTIDSTTKVTYSDTSPSAPATGDYWFDLPNSLWKRYDGATFQQVDRTLIGFAICDDTDCLYARCLDFDTRYKKDNTIAAELTSTEIARGKDSYQKVNVAGVELGWVTDRASWNITTDLATSADMYNASEQASTDYYLYIKDTGETVISDISPYLRMDLFGYYHPHNPWRGVAVASNDGSSDLTSIKNLQDIRQYVTHNGAVGTTSTPTTTSTSFVQLAEMTVTVRTHGNPVQVVFMTTMENSSSSDSFYTIFVDGSEYTTEIKPMHTNSGGVSTTGCMVATIDVDPGIHTFAGYFRAGSNTARAAQTNRYIEVRELNNV